MCYLCCFYVFFFKHKTAYDMRISDWSSDVCASDLDQRVLGVGLQVEGGLSGGRLLARGRNRDDETGGAATLPRLAFERLAVLVERMMQIRRPVEIGRASCRERVCTYV